MEFVSFEIAKKLKEKGYPQVKKNTLAMYNEVGDWYSLAKNLADFEYSFEDFDERDYVCPTISQVLKWLSDKKEVDLVIEPIYFFDENRRREYGVRVFAPWWNKPMHCGYFDTREEAALMGIEYVIDKLIL